MTTILEQTFEEKNLGVCIKDAEGKVLRQNKLCQKICGNHQDKICEIACMELHAKDKSQQWQNWGSRVYNNRYVHDAYYDITLLCSDEHMITYLQPLEKKYKAALNYYKNMDLTKREVEVVTYMIRGVSNTEICNKISVSKATLKTHLNNIYKKIKDKGVELKYIPNQRVSSFSAKENTNEPY